MSDLAQEEPCVTPACWCRGRQASKNPIWPLKTLTLTLCFFRVYWLSLSDLQVLLFYARRLKVLHFRRD